MNKPIRYSAKFHKHYKLRIATNMSLALKTKNRIRLFVNDPLEPILKDHRLKGKYGLLRSFSVSGNYRIIYREYSDHYTFLDIGSHNQVY